MNTFVMLTYQDLLAVPEDDDKARMEFVLNAIYTHKNTQLYKDAVVADEYNDERNTTIIQYQKLLYTMSGEAVPDNISANNKICSNFFNRFVTQEVQYLLGNGTSWSKSSTDKKVGEDFDNTLQDLAEKALVCGISFGFWNLDHLEGFSLLEFAPLWDEEDGSLKAGIRFWQIDKTKPMRATLYELDGYTDYIWRSGKDAEVLRPKTPYKLTLRGTPADGMTIMDGENYPSFPIVPLWGNKKHQSELIGRREQIDAYDLIKSGFANDLDDASQIYWIVQNAGGMDEVDLAKFLEQLRRVKAAVVDDDGAHAESHTLDIPYAARETILQRLRNDLYDDFMALDTRGISGGAITATQIKASYEGLNSKTDAFEYCVLKFMNALTELIGVDDKPTFTRSVIVNSQENVQLLLQAGQYLPEDYITTKLLELFGDADKADEILKQMDEDDMERFGYGRSAQENAEGLGTTGEGSEESLQESEERA